MKDIDFQILEISPGDLLKMTGKEIDELKAVAQGLDVAIGFNKGVATEPFGDTSHTFSISGHRRFINIFMRQPCGRQVFLDKVGGAC